MRAALSLDLDNKWSYMKTHGDPGWESHPSYLDLVVPRALALLADLRLRTTFFVVGQDAAMPKNHEALARIAEAGHNIGNHSFFHEPWMHRRTETEIDDELARAEESIGEATGRTVIGFRGPGFVNSPAILNVLTRRRYAYDASLLPTFIGPLARAYYFRCAKLSPQEMLEREDLFGGFTDGLQPNQRYPIHANGHTLMEVPVTTMPGLRLPIHISYVLYIASVSPALAMAYFRLSLMLCKLSGTEPSILLHPLDFLTVRECPELGFFPAMNLPPEVKARVVCDTLSELSRAFDVVSLEDFVKM